MTLNFDSFDTPAGLFSVAFTDDGKIAATAFGPLAALRRRIRAPAKFNAPFRNEAVRKQVAEYFSGKRRRFALSLAPHGTEFQTQVWAMLAKIPFGETRTYGEIAAEVGNPKASRAIGRANATNPICLLVPCHRVIGSDGSLTGFAFGEDIKRQLLEHEGAVNGAAGYFTRHN